MVRTLILIVSLCLIGAGVTLIVRDLQRSRRKTIDREPDAAAALEAAVATPATPRDVGALAATSTEAARVQRTPGNPATALPSTRGTSILEKQWGDIQPMVVAGVRKVNAVLSLAGLSLSPPGEPCWSYKKEGYGTYQRLMLGNESLARLRLELTQDGKLHAYVKAQASHHADLNGSASTPSANLTAAGTGDLLSACLKPAAAYMAQIAWTGDEGKTADNRSTTPLLDTITAAIEATNGAFAPADARLRPLSAQGWDGRTSRHRVELVVEVAMAEVARMHIERLAHEIEVAVGVREERLINLGRRRRIALEGMTTHALAELIAGCAWPSISYYREARRSA
jgi:hypothetical protein